MMSQEIVFRVLFWCSLVLLVYTFLGYPVLIWFLGRLFPAKSRPANEGAPDVTVVLAAHNEGSRIIPRLQNLLASEYPPEHLSIIVVCDGSTDCTPEKIRQFDSPRVRAIVRSERCGKANCLNIGVAEATGQIVVLCDVRQRFAADTIKRLVASLNHPDVGAVSGALVIESAASAVGGGVDAYWRLEKFLRHSESVFDSSIGCTGAVYAIRRSLYKDIPSDTLLDDVVIPMQIAAQKFRVIFDPSALAYDPQSLEPDREKIRKQRTLAGNYQMLCRYLHWLAPWGHRLWWQLISHKYLRLAAPFLMLIVFLTNAAILNNEFYRLLFFAQCGFYLLAIFGAVFSSLKVPVLSIPAGFVFLNLMSVNGLWHHVRGSYRQGSWPIAKS